jgi:phosphate transport system substrate-binding protein
MVRLWFLLWFLGGNAFFSLYVQAQDTTYVIKGVDAFQPILRQIADAYTELMPPFTVYIQGGGSHNAVRCLNNGIIDAAVSNKPLTEYDIQHFEMRYGKKPIQIPLAYECLSVFVHQDNPIKELSISQVFKIYRNEITNWKELGGPDMPISLYSLEDFSDTYLYFKKSILNDEVPIGNINYLPTWDVLISQMSRDKASISFGPAGIARGVKRVSLKKDNSSSAVFPNVENIKNNTYPVKRGIYLILRDEGTEKFKPFIQWLTSPYSRDIFQQYGFYSEM